MLGRETAVLFAGRVSQRPLLCDDGMGWGVGDGGSNGGVVVRRLFVGGGGWCSVWNACILRVEREEINADLPFALFHKFRLQ